LLASVEKKWYDANSEALHQGASPQNLMPKSQESKAQEN
jgi:hypothetical protein